MNSKVSIIITIYNREKFIEDCVESLFQQTLHEIEYIFIDDASTDRSVPILQSLLEKYPTRKSQSKLILLKENGGVTNARNVGIDNATGEYVIHADSDDWVDIDMYERMYITAKETDADIVGCNICHEYANHTIIHKQHYGNTINENIRNLITGDIHPSLCTSLTNRRLSRENHIVFPIGLNMGEDLYYNLQLYLHAKKIIGIDYAPYHYRHTSASSSFHHTRQTIDSGILIGRKIEELMKNEKRYNEFAKEILFRKFSLKMPLVYNFDNYNNYKYWLQVFPETHPYIWSFSKIDWKLRLELWFASHHMYYTAQTIKKILNWQHSIRHFP